MISTVQLVALVGTAFLWLGAVFLLVAVALEDVIGRAVLQPAGYAGVGVIAATWAQVAGDLGRPTGSPVLDVIVGVASSQWTVVTLASVAGFALVTIAVRTASTQQSRHQRSKEN